LPELDEGAITAGVAAGAAGESAAWIEEVPDIRQSKMPLRKNFVFMGN
jgi:hypothetical protein